jgi:hypothetical protein
MPAKDITTSPTLVMDSNRNRTSIIITNLSGNEAVGILDDPTMTYNQKSVQLTGGQSYNLSIGDAVMGTEFEAKRINGKIEYLERPVYVNQRWVTGAWYLISSSGTQTISYQQIFR